MALPHARTVEVDGKHYQWLVKDNRRSVGWDEDVYGNEDPIYGKTVTIRAENGRIVQHDLDADAVTPQNVKELIRADEIRKRFTIPSKKKR
jgi:hypothetical protein